jgi:tetratricopeptide (TPR) repeat protein
MATGRPSEAVDVLAHLRSDRDLAGFAAFNLGIALMQAGRQQEAIAQLEKAGRLPDGEPASLAIRDKSNLTVGAILFEAGDYERARQALDRVRLDGPFSNQALLRAGWSEVSAQQYERALVPLNILVGREPTDVAVQEAMLVAPYAYASLNLHGRAAIAYGRALELFTLQIEKVDASIDSIREGRFLNALIREESREDEGWVIRLRNLPDAPETYYLMELMASHDFQTALQNYLDLGELRAKLGDWSVGLDAFAEIVRVRRQNYEPLLVDIDAQFRELDTRIRVRLEQRKRLSKTLQTMLTSPRPEYLATAEERSALEHLTFIGSQVPGDSPESSALRRRMDRLRGTFKWKLETEYHERLTAAHMHLHESIADVEALNRQYDAFIRARQAAEHSYLGYDDQIESLRERVGSAFERVELLIDRQGQTIESVALKQLEARRERLVTQQNQARYGVAESYDRAARGPSDAEER